MKETLICKTLSELPHIASELLEKAKRQKIWVLDGHMGAGKTTFVKALGEVLKLQDEVNSPTFSIVNEYRNQANEPVYHFDFYRLDDEIEAMDIGVEDYFESGHFCLIEWASQIPSLLPQHYFHIQIEAQETGERVFTTMLHN